MRCLAIVETISSDTETPSSDDEDFTRQPLTSVGLALAQLKSCYLALYDIVYSDMDPEERVRYA